MSRMFPPPDRRPPVLTDSDRYVIYAAVLSAVLILILTLPMLDG